MKVMSANRGLNIATGVINILTSIATAIFGLVMTIAVGLAYGLSSGLNNDPEVVAEAERMLVLLDWFSIVCLIAVIILFVTAILMFIKKIRYKFILSILSIVSLVAVAGFTTVFANVEDAAIVILYAIVGIVCILHLVNIFVKGEFKGNLLNDVTAFAKADVNVVTNVNVVNNNNNNVVNDNKNVESVDVSVETENDENKVPPVPPIINDEDK